MSAARDFIASGVAVVRTPLLPYDELDAWSHGLRAPHMDIGDEALAAALASDRALLRGRLSRFLERPEIVEALFVASPDLVESLDAWRRDPDSKKGRRTEYGVIRYLLRMSTRPTPFGLFAGCTAGGVGPTTRLRLGERSRYRRTTRFDTDYLFALCEHLARDRELRSQLRFRPNGSLYEIGGRLRYAEARVRGRLRTYHLVAVDSFDALRETLERAHDGASIEELAEALVAADPDGEITHADAEEFLHDLIDNQLLLPELAPSVTGDARAGGLVAQLEDVAAAAEPRARLARADAKLAMIDQRGFGIATEEYRAVAAELEPLGTEVELSRLFQVDMTKPADEVVIGDAVVAETLRAAHVLHRLARPRVERMLDEFRAAFHDRYGADREVPLMEALDEESGIGYDRTTDAAAEASPLLAGLTLQNRRQTLRLAWGEQEAALLDLVMRANVAGRTTVELTDEDLRRLENPDCPPLPDAFQAMISIAAASSDDVDRGDFRLLFHAALGPSGARMLGRFCHTDAEIERGVREHLAAEERLAPDAIFAEIVHLPAGRLGNILARPVLRGHEIVFLGRSGAPRERQIALDDLLVTVSGDRIRLRSRSLGREVIPRLTSAHNTLGESLGVYRFLAAIQRSVGLQWNWGPLETAPFLPRVVSGRTVLARATWRVPHSEIAPLIAVADVDRHRVVERWRGERRIPHAVALADGDNELWVDFRNPLAVDAFLDLVKRRDAIVLTEVFPGSDELCAEGPEGRYVHEIVVPFVAREAAEAVSAPVPRRFAQPVARTFPPGSEWLYAKFYCGTGTADRILDEVVPVIDAAMRSGATDRWFFIRYNDPQWHLRLRLHGDAEMLRERMQPQLEAVARDVIADGRAWKVQFDTYEREVERYGGPAGIELCEELFFRDSEAVVEVLRCFAGDGGADLRWRAILLGMNALMDDFGLDLAAKLQFAERVRDAMARQYLYDIARERIAARLRIDRSSLLRLLTEPASAEDELRAAITVLRRRSRANVPVIEQLRQRERAGQLDLPLSAILPSVIHMHVNRATRAAGPEHELVLYDYLAQLYRSQYARTRRQPEALAATS